jgi:pimeloyl-ACP methyl ester carboxylesterase
MKRVRTRHLDVALFDSGPRDAPVALLLHGWPDDATAWAPIAPRLEAAGFRTIAPMNRGTGPTRFLSPRTPRTGNTGILAVDGIELMDALGVERFVVAGHDWGSNVAEMLAVGWPARVARLAMMGTPSRLGGLKFTGFEQGHRYWYHWFQATRLGTEVITKDPVGFACYMWELWSPPGWFDEATFKAVAKSFRNPDWVNVMLHSYRSRWGEASLDRRSTRLEAKVRATKRLATPNLFLQGGADRVTPPAASEKMGARYSGPFERIVLDGVGHFLPREAPDAVAEHLLRHFGAPGEALSPRRGSQTTRAYS